MKKEAKEPEFNRLCLTCRRACKQSAFAVIADCRRYYPGMKGKRTAWRQMYLPLNG